MRLEGKVVVLILVHMCPGATRSPIGVDTALQCCCFGFFLRFTIGGVRV